MWNERMIRHALLGMGIALMCLGGACAAREESAARSSTAVPLIGVLDRFSAADVPTFGPAEIPTPPRTRSTRPVPAGLPGKGLAQHPMLYVGDGYNKIFVVNGGKIVWTYSTGPGNEHDDIWMLSNGNILFTREQYIAEITPEKEVVWRYDAPAGCEILPCQPIGLDKVLFILSGLPPKLMVVNIKTNTVEASHELDVSQAPDPKKVHGQFRRVRYTAQGTYLIPYPTLGKVVEYDKDFHEVWRFPEASSVAATATAGQMGASTKPAGIYLPNGEKFYPWSAIRLRNGNTLITNEAEKSQMEVSRDRQIIWELKPDDLPTAYRYTSTQACVRLANGNTIVCSRAKNGSGPQLVEVTRDKRVVWVLQDFKELGPATAVQMLDEPGIPENPGESER